MDRAGRAAAGQRDAARRVARVGLPDVDAAPLDRGVAEDVDEADPRALVEQRHEAPPEADELAREAVHVGVPLDVRPVEPRDRVVVAVRVVVAALGAPDLVAHEQHRRARGEQREHEQVLDLARAERLDRGIVRRTLDAAVPAQVLVVAVAAVLAVRLVVLRVVRDEVLEREPVVAGDEVDADLRSRPRGP